MIAAEPKPETKPRKSDRALAKREVQYFVCALFELDIKHELTVDHLLSIPAVRRYQADQGNLLDRTVRDTLNDVSPPYARRGPGRGPGRRSDWEEPDPCTIVLPFVDA